jgi:shikimate kinase
MRLVLAGFMGTGKTAVGRLIASRLDRPFVDLDAWIEGRAGMTVQEIFARQGEAGFRELERAAVREAAAVPDAVISTGGGALLDERNLALLREAGLLVCLTARPEVVAERVAPTIADRPLLRGQVNLVERIRGLQAERAAVYARVPVQIDTSGLTIEQVSDRVAHVLDRAEHSLRSEGASA